MSGGLTQEWRACQQRADELERQYAQAMLAHFRGEGPAPSEEMKAQLVALRNEASQLLARAIADIDRAMRENARKQDKY